MHVEKVMQVYILHRGNTRRNRRRRRRGGGAGAGGKADGGTGWTHPRRRLGRSDRRRLLPSSLSSLLILSCVRSVVDWMEGAAIDFVVPNLYSLFFVWILWFSLTT